MGRSRSSRWPSSSSARVADDVEHLAVPVDHLVEDRREEHRGVALLGQHLLPVGAQALQVERLVGHPSTGAAAQHDPVAGQGAGRAARARPGPGPPTPPATTRAQSMPSISRSAPRWSSPRRRSPATAAGRSNCASGWSGPQSIRGGGAPGGVGRQGTGGRFDAGGPLPPRREVRRRSPGAGLSSGGWPGRDSTRRWWSAGCSRRAPARRPPCSPARCAWTARRSTSRAPSVPDGAALAVAAGPEFVSRGGLKLAGALDALAVDVAGARALDLGASTGGFTDCLLRRGAARGVALDVGYGQLDWRLRQDPRVHVMERTNARALVPGALPWAPDLVTCDLAFISVATVWPAVARCLDPGDRRPGAGQAAVRGRPRRRGVGGRGARPGRCGPTPCAAWPRRSRPRAGRFAASCAPSPRAQGQPRVLPAGRRARGAPAPALDLEAAPAGGRRWLSR